MEKRFADSRERWTAILDAAVDAILVVDAKGVIELFNRAAEQMFSYSQSDVIGQNVKMLMPAPHQSQHDDYIQKYLSTGEPKIIGKGRKVEGLHASGRIFPIFLSIGEVAHASHTQFIGIIHDLSEQENYRLEAQTIREKLAHVARLNAMGELVAGIVHEITQPLSAISNYASASVNLISSQANGSADPPPDEIARKVTEIQRKIEDQVTRASALNNRLKTFMKKRGSQREQVLLNQLILDTVELAKIDSRPPAHKIEVALEQHPEPLVFVDPVQIQQVLLNLIRNGLDAMEQKGDLLRLSSHWEEKNRIKVNVVDEGVGIDSGLKHALFEPFVTSKQQGMGMGLTVSQTIVNAYGGIISFKANNGSGTTFSFTLPCINKETKVDGQE